MCIVGLGIGAACWLLVVFFNFEHYGMAFRNLIVVAGMISMVAYAILIETPASIACRCSCRFTACLAAVLFGFIHVMDNTFPINWIGVIIMVSFGICLEADRLWAVEAAQEKKNLSSGYTGHVCNAQCSVPGDGEKIRSEIREQEVAVDLFVEVLIRTGLSTSHLRSAAERAGRLGNAINWSTAWIVFGLGIWIWLPAAAVWAGIECTFDNGATAYLCILQGLVWSVLFVFVVSSDRKAFAARSLLTMLICLAMRAINVCGMLLVNALLVSPFVLALTLAGPANVARVPLVGPILVRFFIGVRNMRNPCARRGRRFSLELQQSRSSRFSVELQQGGATPDVLGSKEHVEVTAGSV
jgi:hypothetical protein